MNVEGGCVEPLIYGANILDDPGIEQMASVGPGPDGEDFPGEIGSGTPPWALEWAGGTAFTGETTWAVNTNFGLVSANPGGIAPCRFELSTVNPRSGTYHARYTFDPDLNGGAGAELIPVGFEMCDGSGGVWTARVEPGDSVSFSIYAAASDVTTNPNIFMYPLIWNAGLDTEVLDGGSASFFSTLTTSYVEYTLNFVVPADGYYMLLAADVDPNGDLSVFHIDLDDATLSIQTP